MSLAGAAAASRSGLARFGRRARFGWSRPSLRGLTTATALLAYLATAVTAPAWHDHDHAQGSAALACGSCEHEGPHAGHADGDGHDHAGHAGHAHDERPAAESSPPQMEGVPADHRCRVCELLATPAAPVAPPAIADLTAPLPEQVVPAAPDRRIVFIRTWNARGPPRV